MNKNSNNTKYWYKILLIWDSSVIVMKTNLIHSVFTVSTAFPRRTASSQYKQHSPKTYSVFRMNEEFFFWISRVDFVDSVDFHFVSLIYDTVGINSTCLKIFSCEWKFWTNNLNHINHHDWYGVICKTKWTIIYRRRRFTCKLFRRIIILITTCIR